MVACVAVDSSRERAATSPLVAWLRAPAFAPNALLRADSKSPLARLSVAPLLFLARELAARDPSRKPLALYGSRSIADLPLDADLAAVSELRIATEDGSRGTKGRVTVILEEALREHAAAGTPVKVYTCGPEAMMAAVATLCASLDVPCEVSLETPMACGYGVCLGCPVPRSTEGYLYACTEGPCIDASAIAWKRSAK